MTGMYRVNVEAEYRCASAHALIELRGAPGANSIFVMKNTLEILVCALATRQMIQVSGPTGSGKTALISALAEVPENVLPVLRALGLPEKPLRIYPIELAQFETSAELFRVRALVAGDTRYEDSPLFDAIAAAAEDEATHHPVVWLRELGRTNAAVQGALVNIVSAAKILHPDGRCFSGSRLAWITDNNYAAGDAFLHTLCPYDDALRRRFCVNVFLGYLSTDAEELVLRELAAQAGLLVDEERIRQIVAVGGRIRRARAEGTLLSMSPPGIHGYMAVLQVLSRMPHTDLRAVLEHTMCGCASAEDRAYFPMLFHDLEDGKEDVGEEKRMENIFF